MPSRSNFGGMWRHDPIAHLSHEGILKYQEGELIAGTAGTECGVCRTRVSCTHFAEVTEGLFGTLMRIWVCDRCTAQYDLEQRKEYIWNEFPYTPCKRCGYYTHPEDPQHHPACPRAEELARREDLGEL